MIKKFIRSVLHSTGYEIVPYSPIPEPRKPFDVLSFAIEKWIGKYTGFRFVQIGANDGIQNDSFRHLILKYHLPGILVEPMPDYFNKLKQNYSDELQLCFENCAITVEPGELTLYRFRPDAPVPKNFFHGLARVDGEYILRRAKKEKLESHVEKITVPAMCFGDLIKKHQLEKLAFLQIDTEGHDYEILKSVFAENFLPDMINYEYSELCLRDRAFCKKLLLDKGYEFVDVGPDVLCLRGGLF